MYERMHLSRKGWNFNVHYSEGFEEGLSFRDPSDKVNLYHLITIFKTIILKILRYVNCLHRLAGCWRKHFNISINFFHYRISQDSQLWENGSIAELGQKLWWIFKVLLPLMFADHFQLFKPDHQLLQARSCFSSILFSGGHWTKNFLNRFFYWKRFYVTDDLLNKSWPQIQAGFTEF